MTTYLPRPPEEAGDAEIPRVTHAPSPSICFCCCPGELIVAQLHFFSFKCGVGIADILEAYEGKRQTFRHVPYIKAFFIPYIKAFFK